MPCAPPSRSTIRTQHRPLERDILEPEECNVAIVRAKSRARWLQNLEDDDDDVNQLEISLEYQDQDAVDVPGDYDRLQAQGDVEDRSEDLNIDMDQDLPYELRVDNQDGVAFDSLYPANSSQCHTLAEVIFSKMGNDKAARTKVNTNAVDSADPAFGVDPRLVAMFEKIGESMQGTGILHKSVKVLPSFPQWKHFLALTHLERWSSYMMRKATVIFMSTMNSDQAYFFLRHVLLPAVREDMASRPSKNNQKLNIHLYEATLKALYKPAPFFKGFLFPFLDEGCTLKEAVLVASVLAKKAIPSVHLGAALIRLAREDFTGPRTLVMRVLLDKKKDLPFKVLDELVFHYIRVANMYRKASPLPVLWHQSLLVFIQRYAPNLTEVQHGALLNIVRVHYHREIGAEVRRELVASRSR